MKNMSKKLKVSLFLLSCAILARIGYDVGKGKMVPKIKGLGYKILTLSVFFCKMLPFQVAATSVSAAASARSGIAVVIVTVVGRRGTFSLPYLGI